MKLKVKSKFTNISKILPGLVVKLGLDRRMKEHVLLSLWPSLVGPVYDEKSIPLHIDVRGNLIIAVENGSIAQELSFGKPKLLRELKKIGNNLQLEIKDIRFDLKRFHEVYSRLDKGKANNHHENDDTKYPSEAELNAISLSQAELNELTALKAQLAEIPQLGSDENSDSTNKLDNQITRIVGLVERKMRLRKWCILQNVALCSKCGEVMSASARPANIDICYYCALLK